MNPALDEEREIQVPAELYDPATDSWVSSVELKVRTARLFLLIRSLTLRGMVYWLFTFGGVHVRATLQADGS